MKYTTHTLSALTLAATMALASAAQADTSPPERAHPNPGSQQAKIEEAMKKPTMLGGAVVNPKYTIVDAIKHSNEHTTLTNGFAAAKLGRLLYGPGPYTIFAPTNDAFSRLKPDVLSTLQANHKDLRNVLVYHVVPGRINSVDLAKDIEKGKGTAILSTLGGHHLRATMGPNGMILLWDEYGNNAEITQANVVGSNGIVHVLDKVLMPAVK